MKIELYVFVYNDVDILPFFLRHYSPLVDKMTFIDSGSTDGTLDLIKGHSLVQTGLTWWDWDNYQKIRNNIWRDSTYDLVFFPDADEILYRENLRQFLETNRYSIYQMEGYQMVSNRFPKVNGSLLDIKEGFPYPLYSKFSIFSPKADICFDNAHTITTPEKNVCKFQIKLLHYKFVGVPFLLKRAKAIKERVPPDSYSEIIGGNILEIYPQFIRTKEEYAVEIEQMLRKAKKVI